MAELVSFDTRILKVPYILLAGLLAAAAWQRSWWLLLGIPLIYLGWAGSAPNLNLMDGCLPQLSLIAGVVLALIFANRTFFQLGLVTWIGWLACSLELAWRCETGRTGVVD